MFTLEAVETDGSVLDLSVYHCVVEPVDAGVNIRFCTKGNVFSTPCGKLFDLKLRAKADAKAGTYTLRLLPMMDENGNADLLDKQGHEMSFALTRQTETYHMGGGWNGVYQSVDSAEWWQSGETDAKDDQLADITLLSGSVMIIK